MTTAEIVAFFALRAEAFSRHDAVALAATHVLAQEADAACSTGSGQALPLFNPRSVA
jgi:hypothetical protein